LQIPHIQGVFSTPGCRVLHRIVFAVVSEWYQEAVGQVVAATTVRGGSSKRCAT
jgi:hypothetical protein